jgi:malonyl-CoA decarboxylase
VFDSLLNSVAEAGRDLLRGEWKRLGNKRPSMSAIDALCQELLSSKGEALGTALAQSVVEACRGMDQDQILEFFQLLLERYSASREEVDKAIEAYKAEPCRENLHNLHRASEPPRQELFRRMNMAPDGTATIVFLRAALLNLLDGNPELREVDLDLRHLMASWFNRGFLKLRRIDWHTPAILLEKLIAYEAVHAMDGWDDLRRRLAEDRRCFAFLHPAMDEEPLIFVEVALTRGLADSIQTLLDAPVDASMQRNADTAIFYSISDCQAGLQGISFGNFLIKQVVMELQREFPELQVFATLSPIPGFCNWLHAILESGELTLEQAHLVAGFDDPARRVDIESNADARDLLTGLCANYLYSARQGRKPLDAVARFHLRNGASIGRLNWGGDVSDKGIRESAGFMVNYRYELSRVESRHEDYVNQHRVAAEKEFLKGISRGPVRREANAPATDRDGPASQTGSGDAV